MKIELTAWNVLLDHRVSISFGGVFVPVHLGDAITDITITVNTPYKILLEVRTYMFIHA